MLAPPLDSRPPSFASRLVAVWTAARRAVRLAAVRWTAAQLGSCVLATRLDSRRPSVASRPRRRLYSGAARQLCAGPRRGETAVRWRRHRLEAAVRRLPSHRRLDSGAVSGAASSCALAPPLDSRRPSVASHLRRRQYSSAASSCALNSGAVRQQCAGAAFDSRPPSFASRLIAVWTAVDEAAVRWRRLSTRDARPSPLISVAAWTAARRAAVRWTAARRGSRVLAPPLDSRSPSVASRLRRRRLSSPSPSGQRRGERCG